MMLIHTANRHRLGQAGFAVLMTSGLMVIAGCASESELSSTLDLGVSEEMPAVVHAGPGELPIAEHPHEAHEQRILQWQDENGNIADDALVNALRQRGENIAAQQAVPGVDLNGDQLVGTQGRAWVQRGPDNIGGRTRALVIDPRNTQRMFAGGVSGGLWRSENAGLSWEIVDDWWPSLAVGCIALDPKNPDIMYVGTGEGFFNGDAISGAGVFKSTDGGATFDQLARTAHWQNVCRIAISPQDSERILAATRSGGISLSVNGGFSWYLQRGAQGAFDVDFHPTNENLAIGHIIDYDNRLNNWVHSAVYSRDAGSTWNLAAGLDQVVGFLSRIEVAYAPSQPNIVYASVALDGKIWKSTDGGQSYSPQTTSGASGSSWYANPLWVDPTNAQVLTTGGYHCQRSMDGGKTLVQISNGYINTQQAHPDIHQFFEDPNFDGNGNRRVWVVTDGGPYVTDDIYSVSGTSGWERREQNYRTTQYYGAVGDGPSGKILGGLQDNGSLRLEIGNESAHLMFGGDGGFCAIDRTDPDYMYGEYINLMIHRSTNGGQSASYIYSGIEDAGTDANFIAPFILDPNNPNCMLAGGRSLWRSNAVKSFNRGWERIAGPNSDRISAIAVAEGNSDIAWYGQNNGEIYRSLNATAADPTWAAVDNNGSKNPLPNRYITRILIDADDHETAYVSLGGFTVDNLYRTTDGGLNWFDITGELPTGLPDAPVRGVARHPDDAQRLFVGTQVGIFETTDGGVTWSTSEAGPASVSVDEVNFMHDSGVLLIATHGRGIFTRNVGVDCLSLVVDELIGDTIASILVENGTPGSAVAVLWGTKAGSFKIEDQNGWCADFGIKIPTNKLNDRILARGTFDKIGRFVGFKRVPGNVQGTRVFFQAAERGSCPESCTSNLVDHVVQ